MKQDRSLRSLAIILLCGATVLAGCSLSAAGGTGKSGRMSGRVRFPFDLPFTGSGKRLDCDRETERIGRVDGELVCVEAVSPAAPEPESKALD